MGVIKPSVMWGHSSLALLVLGAGLVVVGLGPIRGYPTAFIGMMLLIVGANLNRRAQRRLEAQQRGAGATAQRPADPVGRREDP